MSSGSGVSSWAISNAIARQSNCKLVYPGDDLQDAYDWIKSPNRDAQMGVLSATNWRCLILMPGLHVLTDRLSYNTGYIALVGMDASCTFLYQTKATSTQVIYQTAHPICVSNLTLYNSTSSSGSIYTYNVDVSGTNASVSTFNDGTDDHYMLTSAGAVAGKGVGYNVTTDDEAYVSGGSVTPGWYRILKRIDDNTVELCINPGNSTNDVSYKVISQHNHWRDLILQSSVMAADKSSCITTWSLSKMHGGLMERVAAGYGAFRCSANIEDRARWYDCQSGNFSFGGDSAGVKLAGKYIRCRAGDYSFVGCAGFAQGECSGEFYDCIAGNRSFATTSAFTGYAENCRAGINSFGGGTNGALYGTFSGTLNNCDMGDGSAGAGGINAMNTGKMYTCRLLGYSSTINIGSGSELHNCLFQVSMTGINGVTIISSTVPPKIEGCTIKVFQGGSGIPIYSASPKSAAISRCSMNNAIVDSDGIGVNVTNSIGTCYNVIDDDL
jgi:hypothetical protein